MKIQFDKIETKKDSITVFDGEKDIIITKDKFQWYLDKNYPILINVSEFVPNLENLTVTGNSVHKVIFSPEQNQKQIEFIKNHITLPSMTFDALEAYNFEPNKTYGIYINQDCMNNSGYHSRLRTFFMNNNNVIRAIINNDVTSIPIHAFQDSSLKSITIPDSVTSIGNYAFYDCRSLKSITIPNSVTSIGNYAFRHCEITYNGTKEQWSSIPISNIYECTVHCTNGDIRYPPEPM